jgi:SET domain-containing protein
MLRVKTQLKESKIKGAGIGLFADEFIPKDTIIWEYDSKIDNAYLQEEYDKVTGLDKEFLKRYCFKYLGVYYLCVDNARFFNHSDAPNCYSADFNKINLGYTKALRDIEVGEELTDDYLGFGFTKEDKEFNKFH